MHRLSLHLPLQEATLLWNYFDAVSSSLAARMDRGSPPGEENLTFLLGELLDESASEHHRIEPSLASVQAALQAGDTGIAVDVRFETHPHNKFHESRYSGADLGLVLHRDHPLLGRSTRAVLLQAKRLFPSSSDESRAYGLDGQYSSFDAQQVTFLQELAKRFRVPRSIFYLLYNPGTRAFTESDVKHLRAYEAFAVGRRRVHWHRYMDFDDPYWALMRPLHIEQSSDAPDSEHHWRSRQPATRVSDLEHVSEARSASNRLRLRGLYEAAANSDALAFSPFADFMLLALLSPYIGDDDANWVRLAQGEAVELPLREGDDHPELTAEMKEAPIPRHTLRITLRSTLPPFG